MEGDSSPSSTPAPPNDSSTSMVTLSSSLSSSNSDDDLGQLATAPSASAPPAVARCSETTMTTGKKVKTEDAGVDVTSPSHTPGVSKSGQEGSVDEEHDVDDPAGSGFEMLPGQLHPLENPVILAHLFERCPPKLLAKFRLVCKQWWDLSLTCWRATSQIKWFVRRRANYLEFVDSPSNKCSSKPHRRMKLSLVKNDMEKKEIQEFWDRFGSNLTSLEFHDCRFPRVEDLRRIIFRACPNLKRVCFQRCRFLEQPKPTLVEGSRELDYVEPTFGEQTNLRLFSVENPDFDPSGHGHNRFPISWMELFSYFPCLTSMTRSATYCKNNGTINDELVKAIQVIRQRDEKKLRLRNLYLNPPLKTCAVTGPHPEIFLLEELQLPLQCLEIEFDLDQEVTDGLVEDILDRHRKTLSRITVSRKSPQGNELTQDQLAWLFPFPANVRLEELRMLRIHTLCESLQFLKNTPSLERLEILEKPKPSYGHVRDMVTRIIPEVVAGQLAEVKLLNLRDFRLEYWVPMEDITIFAGLMPNLTNLTMPLDDEQFSAACGQWRNLREMEVLGDDLTDEGVTGLEEDEDLERGNGTDVTPNITNLQNLRSFTFSSSHLTERSIYGGFLELPNLRVLQAGNGIQMGYQERQFIRDADIEFHGDWDGRDYDWDQDGFLDEDEF